MGVEANDFGVGGSIPGGHKEEVNVVTGQLGILQAIFVGKTIVAVGPDPKRRRGLLLKFSDGSTVGFKTSIQKGNIDLTLQGNDVEQPRHFLVASG